MNASGFVNRPTAALSLPRPAANVPLSRQFAFARVSYWPILLKKSVFPKRSNIDG